MSKGWLHNPAVIDRLRPLRAAFARWRARHERLRPHDSPEASLRALGGKAIFMLSFGRSGTTVLGDLLGSHPDIIKMGEVLNESTFRSYFRSLRYRLGGKRPSQVKRGFYRFLKDRVQAHPRNLLLFDMKLECLHLIDGNFRNPGYDFAFFDALLAADCPVILIERRDHVARYLSLALAVHHDRFHSFQQSSEPAEKLVIDIGTMAAVVATTKAQIAFARDHFKHHPRFLYLAFEELFAASSNGASHFDPDLARRLSGLLEVDASFNLAPRLEPVNLGRTMDMLANRAEVEAWMSVHG